jgi:ribonuclease PH
MEKYLKVAILHDSKEISLLQMDGEISKEDLIKALELAKIASEKVYQVQIKALKEKYGK